MVQKLLLRCSLWRAEPLALLFGLLLRCDRAGRRLAAQACADAAEAAGRRLHWNLLAERGDRVLSAEPRFNRAPRSAFA